MGTVPGSNLSECTCLSHASECKSEVSKSNDVDSVSFIMSKCCCIVLPPGSSSGGSGILVLPSIEVEGDDGDSLSLLYDRGARFSSVAIKSNRDVVHLLSSSFSKHPTFFPFLPSTGNNNGSTMTNPANGELME